MNAESRPLDGAASHESAGRPFANSKITGDIDLVAISESSNNPRYEVYLAGWSAGFESQQARIDRLTRAKMVATSTRTKQVSCGMRPSDERTRSFQCLVANAANVPASQVRRPGHHP